MKKNSNLSNVSLVILEPTLVAKQKTKIKLTRISICNCCVCVCVVNCSDVIKWHITGFLGTYVFGQPPVRMALVYDNQLVVLLNCHVVLGGALIIKQSNVIWLL
ncbi:hypothetical protein BpHYR1_038105 [Brachionus plicatilis]|uniref:Uncharacterized protein n=1 Tax=Brachionus plicatilis TaxID=10195 RepID=A0A3M7Q3A5_BRAPC|nr:hypothetical protein BpHYR1_038105 [Brachionus plicatilis]